MLCLTAFGMVNAKLKHKKCTRVQNTLVSSAGFSDNSLLNKTSHEKNKTAVVLQNGLYQPNIWFAGNN